MYERENAAATLRFYPDGPKRYAILLEGKEGASGTDLKAAINDAFRWMFVNTDALLLRGAIAENNKQCLAMVPHVFGYRIEYGEAFHVFKVTIASWAKAYGLENALSELRAAGQTEKADALESAAQAAGEI